MTFQIVSDMQPWQLAVDMSMKRRRDLFGLIEQAERDVHHARQIVVASGDPQRSQKLRVTPGLMLTLRPSFGENVTSALSKAANAATGAPVTRRQSVQWQ